MPIPKPRKGETKTKFITRCMSDPIMSKEYPDQKQRGAVCYTEYKKRNSDEMTIKKDQIRIDYLSSDNNEYYMIEKFQRDSEGYLRGRAIITNVGVFPYILEDGTVFYELRCPEEVFDSESIKSFEMLPLTNDHPPERVNKDNIKKYQVGHLGDSVTRDEYHLSAPILITDEEAIIDVENGKTGLSNGYKCDVEETPGVWMGIHYDGIQRNIRGNHVAIVNRGRAGDAARIKLDSAIYRIQTTDKTNEKGVNKMPEKLKKVNIDGVDYEAEKEVVTAYTQVKTNVDSLNKEIETLNKDISTAQAKIDQLTEDNKKLKADLEQAQNQDAKEKINAAVKEKMVLFDAANRAGVEIKEDIEDIQIKKDVVIKLFPSAESKLDNADEAYIDARFDMALEYLDQQDNEENNDSSNLDVLSNDTIDKGNPKKRNTVDEAYKNYVNRMQTNWNREDK